MDFFWRAVWSEKAVHLPNFDEINTKITTVEPDDEVEGSYLNKMMNEHNHDDDDDDDAWQWHQLQQQYSVLQNALFSTCIINSRSNTFICCFNSR